MHCPVLKGYEEPQSIFQVIPTAQETSTGKLHKALIIGKEKLKKISTFSVLLHCLCFNPFPGQRFAKMSQVTQFIALSRHLPLPPLPPPQNCLQIPHCPPGPHLPLLRCPTVDDFLAPV